MRIMTVTYVCMTAGDRKPVSAANGLFVNITPPI